MKIEAVDPSDVREALGYSKRRVERAAKSCMEGATPKAVHEARTSIHKLLTAVSLTPKRFRTDAETRKALRRVKLFYKSCADIRDIDTIVHTLASDDRLRSAEGVARELHKGRVLLLSEMLRSARRSNLGDLPKPEPGTKRRLRARLLRLIEAKAVEALRSYDIAGSDQRRQSDLHSLRKECREIRYLLDFAVPSEEVDEAKAVLEEARSKLGAIRDDDLTLHALMRAAGNSQLSSAVADSRRRKYAAFFAKGAESGGERLSLCLRQLR